jgi:hypothetical protein
MTLPHTNLLNWQVSRGVSLRRTFLPHFALRLCSVMQIYVPLALALKENLAIICLNV